MEWNRNVHIFRQPQLTPLTLRDDWLIWGIGYPRRDFTDAVLADFALPTDKPSILLMHGMATDLAWSPGKEPAIRLPLKTCVAAGSGSRSWVIATNRTTPMAATCRSVMQAVRSHWALANRPATIFGRQWEAGRWHLESIDISQWRCPHGNSTSRVAPLRRRSGHVRGSGTRHRRAQVVGSVRLLGTADPDASVSIADIVRELESRFPHCGSTTALRWRCGTTMPPTN
jgi:hypothetical protein